MGIRTVKKIFEEKLGGRREEGRPSFRWIDDVEDDLRNMDIKRWRIKALDRVERASIVKEAKAKLKGPVVLYRKKKMMMMMTMMFVTLFYLDHFRD
jgi:hypothetical protein